MEEEGEEFEEEEGEEGELKEYVAPNLVVVVNLSNSGRGMIILL